MEHIVNKIIKKNIHTHTHTHKRVHVCTYTKLNHTVYFDTWPCSWHACHLSTHYTVTHVHGALVAVWWQRHSIYTFHMVKSTHAWCCFMWDIRLPFFFVTSIQDTCYRIVMPHVPRCIHYALVREKGQMKLTNTAQELDFFWEVCTLFKTN